MSRKAEFYSIALWKDGCLINYSISYLLESINDNNLTIQQVSRRIGEKWIRFFPFYYSDNKRQFVIPFGKTKDKNKPYWINAHNELEEIPAQLYDVNSLGYDKDYNVMLFTTNREGPSVQNIEEYLNTFIPDHTGIFLKIEPIMYNTGIEKIRNAQLVRGIDLYLDLGSALNNFYMNEIEENHQNGLAAAFKSMANASRNELGGKVLSLSLGLGKKGKNDDTLNLESMLYLLENININAEFVKEIRVRYKNGIAEKIDIAKLKQSDMLLFYSCKSAESQVSPESLLRNINDAVADKVLLVNRHNTEYFSNIQCYDGTMFNIITEWKNDTV